MRVRFDRLLESHLKDGVFVFHRPTNMNLGSVDDPAVNDNCSMPYPREKADKLERIAVRGQRAVFLLGLYHARPPGSLALRLKDGALHSAGGDRLALTEIEWTLGFLAPRRYRLLRPFAGSEPLRDERGMPYFVLSFQVPRDAKPGRYEGEIELVADNSLLRSIPVVLRVQNLELPVLRDISVGAILQTEPLTDEVLRQYRAVRLCRHGRGAGRAGALPGGHDADGERRH